MLKLRLFIIVFGLLIGTLVLVTDAISDFTDVLLYKVDRFGQDDLFMMWNPETDEYTPLPFFVAGAVPNTNNQILYGSDWNNLYFMDIANPNSEPINITQARGTKHIIGWSPDGSRLAFATKTRITPSDEPPPTWQDNKPTPMMTRAPVDPTSEWMLGTTELSGDREQIYVWQDGEAKDITPIGMNAYLIPTDPNAYIEPPFNDKWSPDGRFLPMMVYRNRNNRWLLLWDGQSHHDITPRDLSGIPLDYTVKWSPDGKLAITVWYRLHNSLTTGVSETYVWDGRKTTKINNPLPYEELSVLGWSPNGRLVLSSRQYSYELESEDEDSAIIIWDGWDFNIVDMPETSSLNSQFAPRDIYWTPEGLLAFRFAPDVYIWDGESIHNISQLEPSSPGLAWDPVWREDGHWAFAFGYFGGHELVIRDEANQTILTYLGNQPIWSADGLLASCQGREQNLVVWDGTDLTLVTEGRFVITARWLIGNGYGDTINCSTG